MADADVTITLKAQDQATQELSRAIGALSGSVEKLGEQFERANKKSEETTKKAKFSWTELKSKIDIVIGGVQQLGQVVEQVFQFGMQGGIVEQTTLSFERLLEQVGATPDLLDRMRESARGTVDDLTLMSSTLTLAAGVPDEIAKQMLEVAPQLLKIAEAATALNPKLGDTAFLYQSLMTGIKRYSPFLIDNTGLTLRLGEVTEKYAKELGKSVDELTDAERKQALINATLEAGENLLRQVGGTTESATDSFERLSTSWKNLKDAAARDAAPGLAMVADALSKIFEEYDKYFAVGEKLDEALQKGIITQKEYDRLMGLHKRNILDVDFLEGELTEQITEHEQELRRLNAMTVVHNDEEIRAKEAFEKSQAAAQKYAEEHDRNLRPAIEATKDVTEQATSATKKWLDEIDTGLPDSIDKAIEAIDTFIAGGWEVQLEFEHVMQQLREDRITPEEAREKFQELLVQGIIIQGQVNGLTFDEIAQNIADGLKVPLWEARQIASDLVDKMRALDGMEATVKIRYTYSGAPGSGTAGETGGRASGEAGEKQAGGPVWAGRPYLVGEAGPEMFTPTSSGYITNNTTTYNMTVNTAAQSSTVIADYNLMRAMAGA